MVNSFLNKDYLSFMTSVFKSDEEKEKERLDKIYTNPVSGEVERYASGLMGMRPEVQAQMQRQIDAQKSQPIMGQTGPDGKPIGFFDALAGVRPIDLTQGTVKVPNANEMQTDAMAKSINKIYDLDKGTFKSDAVADAVKNSNISPSTLLTLLSAFTSNNQVKPPMPTTQATATKGLVFNDEDPYKRYRGGIL